jgi:predicted GNAT family acetyltransferase
MTMFAKYKKEREGKEVLENDKGFAVYYYLDPETCYLEDIFVEVHARCEGIASQLADEICIRAKEKGCKQLLGSVHVAAHNSTVSLKVLLAYGMKLHSVNGQMIYFMKEI